MSILATFRCWWRGIVHPARTRHEVENEFQFHVDAYANDLIRQGMAPTEANRKVRIDLGRPDKQGEKYREAVGLRLWDETWNDFRYGLRDLWRNPGFAAVTILSLALSIGMATAMFSLVHAVLLDVYPYANSDRTVNPIIFDPAHPDAWEWFYLSRAQFETYRSSPAFEDVLGMINSGAQLQDADGEHSASIVALTPNAAQFLRINPLVGRGLRAADGGYGSPSPDIVVLGYKFWLKQYGGDATVLGRKLTIADGAPGQPGKSYTIVGVMPERFTLGGTPDLYMPTSQIVFPDERMIAFAKLKSGITAKQASSAVDPMIHGFAHQDPNMYPKKFETRLQLLINGFTDRSKFVRSLPVLFLAVTMLLLIGCANCSILLLARGTARTHEFALRSAIGASPSRLVRQLLMECLMISFLGSALGVALSYLLARLPLQLAGNLFPSESVIRVDLSVLAFSVLLASAVGVLFGFWPALRFSRPQISQMLQKSSRRTATRGGQKTLSRLIGVQIALTLVLLTIAGGAVTGFVRLTQVKLGYNPRNLTFVAAGFNPPFAKTWAEQTAKNEQLREAIAGVPGVEAVAMSNDILFQGGAVRDFQIVGESEQPADRSRLTNVSANYFSTLQISLLSGRVWTEAEARLGLPLAVVNQVFVRQYSPDRSILNRVIRFPSLQERIALGAARSPAFTSPEVQVVGVVGDAVNDGLDKPVLPNVYINSTLLLLPGLPMLMRTQGEPAQYSSAIKRSLRKVGAGFTFVSEYSLEQMIRRDEAWRRQQLTATLFGIFAVAALALALVGLYSVVAYLVAQRTQEFGIRLALGAPRAHILWLVLKRNVAIILFGTAIGLALSAVVRRQSERWLEGSSQSPSAMAATAVLLVLVAIFACFPPARRAAKTDPNKVLHAE